MPASKKPSQESVTPVITIVIPTYNYSPYIRRALDSALNQTFSSDCYEVLIIDDGSTDDTQKILASGKYCDRIRVLRQENQGYVKAANRGFREAHGEYVIKLDADDEFLPGILQALYDALRKQPEAAFAYGDYYELDDATGERKEVKPRGDPLRTVAIGTLFRKTAMAEAGFYDEGLVFPEYDLLLKIQKLRPRPAGIYVPGPLFIYHRHGTSLTADRERVVRGIRQLEERYGKKIRIREY